MAAEDREVERGIEVAVDMEGMGGPDPVPFPQDALHAFRDGDEMPLLLRRV